MQIPFTLDHATSFALEDFIVSPTNQLAYDIVKAWPDWPYHITALVGPEACGKTHLAHGWAKLSGAVVYEGAAFPDVTIDPELSHIVIDNIAADAFDENKLFHLINWTKENQTSVLLTCRYEPTRWDIKLPDLRSRLSLIQVANINAPDDQLLMILLYKMFSDRQLTVDLSVINFIVPRMERSFAAVRELVIAMDAKALSRKTGISIKIAKECLKDMKML
ncbi:DnaA ATPase domain-containing protein [Kordiimonas sp. SCSIO 12610]|uniref:DnaA ATPase domain-containing protein n=1 Tax=Kordiimonas sp. SCSIO 12610 TaxID=2829597 RepID=UPI00210A6169|nr:DnaA/Hda family protein [Kordiimonas sp. SCSIO 12610]UTW53889.1 hypothetical protein KFF44_08510 [Kordiimonas sp. SCSIO 12610]